jgi:hypothetical protein
MASGARRLVDMIHDRFDAGALPRGHPERVWAEQGEGEACSACDQTLLPAHVIYEFEWREHTYRFHTGCYGLWQGELIRRGLFKPR